MKNEDIKKSVLKFGESVFQKLSDRQTLYHLELWLHPKGLHLG